MQFSIAVALLAATTMAQSASQVKDELDAHPWRPDPTLVVIGTPTQNGTAPKSPVPPTPMGEIWQLQIAALSSFEAAKAEQKRLEQIPGATKIEIFTEGSIHRVRIGAYPSKEAAESAREALRPRGVDGFPVRKP